MPLNKTNLKSYPILPEKLWLTEDNKHLIFDYVHLLKIIHNLWLTEKTGDVTFDKAVKQVAKWPHLKLLYHFVSERLVKLADLNKISIAPKSLERQQVSIYLRGFSEENMIYFSLSLE